MGSWGRHGWPRANEFARIYRERDGSHMILFVPAEGSGHDAIANVLNGPSPSSGNCTVSRDFTYNRGCKRVQWSELPPEWQRAFGSWLGDTKPEDIRGFWLAQTKKR